MMKKSILIAIFFASSLAAAAQGGTLVDGVAAVVGRNIIKYSDIDRSIAQMRLKGSVENEAETRCAILENLVLAQLMVHKGEVDSVEVSDDDVKRLAKGGALKPKKYGQGIASQYSLEDMFCLLDVKIHLLAGNNIAEMIRITKADDYDFDEGIAEKIYTYKRQIKLLEFIRLIKADARKISKLSSQQLAEMS